MKNNAREFALKAHGDQKYGEFPYYVHLDEVAKIASQHSGDLGEKAEIVAYLHDVVEDTDVTPEQVENSFGSLVARCVSILSDEPGETRADRLANMRACVRSKNKDFLKMYIEENKVFKEAAYRPDLCDEIWEEINKIESSA